MLPSVLERIRHTIPRARQRRNNGDGSIAKTPNGKYKETIKIGVVIDDKKKTPSISETSFLERVSLLSHL